MNREYLGAELLPDIAGTHAAIERFSVVPIGVRLDYLAKRSHALSLHGLAGWNGARDEALSALDDVYRSLIRAERADGAIGRQSESFR